MKESFNKQVEALEEDWASNHRWDGVKRDYSAEDVVRLRGLVLPKYSIAEHGANLLWERLSSMDYVHALGRRFNMSKLVFLLSICQDGKLQVTPTFLGKYTQIRVCTPSTRSHQWLKESTTL